MKQKGKIDLNFMKLYFESIFTNQRIKYKPTPKPKNKTETIKATLINPLSQPSFSLNQPVTPKIIYFFKVNIGIEF